MKDYDKNKDLNIKKNKNISYLKHWDVNNLYGLAMSQKPLVNKFEPIFKNILLNLMKIL